ncbi:MAG: FecR domain-containing protein [Steroidobacteraceae bacterium]
MNPRDEQVRDLIAAQALEWFTALRSGELPAAQREAFIDWLRASPAHAREYLAVSAFVEDFARAAEQLAAPTETLIMHARVEIQADTVRPLFPDAEQRTTCARETAHRPNLWATLAGLTMAAAMTIFLAIWWLQDRTTYSTAHAEQRSWRMPDGSTVHLNSDSAIRVNFDGEHRQVDLLRGQALFQVAKDPRRPFWVRAGETVVKAVGTEFDVYRHKQRTLVSVVEGRVAVWRLPDDSFSSQVSRVLESEMETTLAQPLAQLSAGQQVRISHSSAGVSDRADDVRKTVAWLQRQVVFDHDSLGNAVEEFNRYDQLRIRVDDPALRATEISGIFSAYDVESFVHFLGRQPDLRVERVDGEIIISTATQAHQ